MNAGIIMQRVLRVLDSTDMRSLSSHELAETITAAILDLPEQYWVGAPADRIGGENKSDDTDDPYARWRA